MIPKDYPSGQQLSRRAVGADVGATLVKLAVRSETGRTEFRILPAHAIERVAREVESARPGRVGLTGGGAPRVATLLEMDTERVTEFEAWVVGAEEMLRKAGLEVPEPYMLVSVGTGTSALRVDGGKATRIGGTALGGGTILGLGAGLIGISHFEELTELARRGDRRRVDLLVGDIDSGEAIPLPREMNASSFAKLGLHGRPNRADPADMAHAVMGLVGENVGIICGTLAALVEARAIVYAGSSLRDNPALSNILVGTTAARGGKALLLPEGEFAGALGALRLATHGDEQGFGEVDAVD